MGIKKGVMGSAMAMVLALGIVSSGVSFASDIYNDEPTTGEMLADAAIVRPLTLVASAVGAVTWVITLPFTFASGNAGEFGKAVVVDPLEYTFARPVGDMTDNR